LTEKAAPRSSWHWHTLHALGLLVICLDARQAKAALSAQVNKTDKHDAGPAPAGTGR
jgi:transposase